MKYRVRLDKVWPELISICNILCCSKKYFKTDERLPEEDENTKYTKAQDELVEIFIDLPFARFGSFILGYFIL